jgi:hypothetical protein
MARSIHKRTAVVIILEKPLSSKSTHIRGLKITGEEQLLQGFISLIKMRRNCGCLWLLRDMSATICRKRKYSVKLPAALLIMEVSFFKSCMIPYQSMAFEISELINSENIIMNGLSC